jgi:hypothetical protein
MRRIHLVLIGVAVVIVLLALFVITARPTLVLPTYTVSPASNPLVAYQQKLNVNALDVVLRTDGKVVINADGAELAHVSYNLYSLGNGVDLAVKMLVPESTRKIIGIVPFIFPQSAWNAFLNTLLMYYVLPVEITVKFVRG